MWGPVAPGSNGPSAADPTAADAALATAAAAAAPGLNDTRTELELLPVPPDAPMAPSREGEAPGIPPEASEAAGLFAQGEREKPKLED